MAATGPPFTQLLVGSGDPNLSIGERVFVSSVSCRTCRCQVLGGAVTVVRAKRQVLQYLMYTIYMIYAISVGEGRVRGLYFHR